MDIKSAVELQAGRLVRMNQRFLATLDPKTRRNERRRSYIVRRVRVVNPDTPQAFAAVDLETKHGVPVATSADWIEAV